jgi:hypothetical protein
MLSRTLSIKALIVLSMAISFLFSCGGGGGDSEKTTSPADDNGAVKESFNIKSESVYGLTYNISVGIPPVYNEAGSPHPAIFLLDGNYYFNNLYDGYDEDDDYLLIGINNSDRRHIDYLPASNTCEKDSGADAFFDFLVSELIPYLDEHYNIDPELRVLFGHSYGGSFVFYTLFIDHGDTFPILFSNEASLQCWDVSLMEKNYYASNESLPVIFYSAAATAGDGNSHVITPVMDTIIRRDYNDLIVKYETFYGTHDETLGDAFTSGFNWISDQVDGPSD